MGDVEGFKTNGSQASARQYESLISLSEYGLGDNGLQADREAARGSARIPVAD